MGAHGWPFANVDAFPGADADPLFGAEHVKDLYMRVNPDYEGRSVCTARSPCTLYSAFL